jgi:DNA-binding MarR family transcriptional regulator
MGHDAPADSVDEAIALLQEVVQLFRVTLSNKIDAPNLPLGQLRAMTHVYHHRSCTVGEVAAGIGVSLATASELLERLVESGWVERSANPADRRQVVVTLTPRAVAIGERVHQMRRRQIGAAFDDMEEDEQHGFIVGLRAVIGSLNAALKPEPSREQGQRMSNMLGERVRAAFDASISSANS